MVFSSSLSPLSYWYIINQLYFARYKQTVIPPFSFFIFIFYIGIHLQLRPPFIHISSFLYLRLLLKELYLIFCYCCVYLFFLLLFPSNVPSTASDQSSPLLPHGEKKMKKSEATNNFLLALSALLYYNIPDIRFFIIHFRGIDR